MTKIKYKKQSYSFLFFFLISIYIDTESFFNFTVWNIGQGSWSTYQTENSCLHFDMGGDPFDFSKINPLCKNKTNQIYLTHLDRDHINLIHSFLRLQLKTCLFYPKKHNKKWLDRIEKCQLIHPLVKVISWGKDHKDKNSSSIIYLVKNKILITGDAPKSEEKKWFKKVPKNIQLLLLGHHGSQTSTSLELLQWARPQMTVASARKSRYGHPHAIVIKKLRDLKIPLLKTEELGHLHFQIR